MKKSTFSLVSMFTIVAMFLAGLPFGFVAGVAPNVSGIFWFLSHVVVKFVAVLLFSRLFTSLVARSLIGSTIDEMFMSMKTKVVGQENLSPMFVIGGLSVATGLIFALAHATTFPVYMYEVLTKGSIGLLIGLLFAAYEARRAGVRSASAFNAFYRDPGNNQVVAYVMTMFNVAVFLAMLS